MNLCKKQVAEHCAKQDGHSGECRCTYFHTYDETRAALDTLVRLIQTTAPDLRRHEAFQLAQTALKKTPLSDAERSRHQAEWQRKVDESLARREQDSEIVDDEAHERGVDARRGVQALFANIKASLPELEKLLNEFSSHWGYEDPVYRQYHRSFKVYWLQESTQKIVDALQALAPGHPLNRTFSSIVSEGTGRTFQFADNERWEPVTRPMVEAFFHSRFFLEMAVRYGRLLSEPPMLRISVDGERQDRRIVNSRIGGT